MSDALHQRGLLEHIIHEVIAQRVPASKFSVPVVLENYVEVDEETGIPRPLPVDVSELPMPDIEHMMSVFVAWSDYLRSVAGDLDREATQVQGEQDVRDYRLFAGAGGSVEMKKKMVRADNTWQKLDFDRRVLEGAAAKLKDRVQTFDSFVGVLKYAHRGTNDFQRLQRGVPGA